MKKYLILAALFIFSLQDVCANHTKGGWMYYEYLGPGINNPAFLRYRIGLNLYIDCGSVLIEPTWNFSFFSGRFPHAFIQDVTVTAAPDYTITGCVLPNCYPCLSNIPSRCYKIINYETIVELAPSTDGYIVSKQRCCRVTGISNLQAPSTQWGAMYTIKIPGTNTTPTAPTNSSPQFIFNDTAVVCAGSPFNLNFKATDIDGDSLDYSFVPAYDGPSVAGNPNPTTASTPPYNTIGYVAPYSGVSPLGAAVNINPVTGIISGIAPPVGEYVICVLVKEYKNGIYIGESRKEIHLKTAPCTPIVATPSPDFTTCDGFTVNFFHNSSGANTVFWDFGDGTTLADTSWLNTPTYTYPDTGIYIVTFIINRGQQCTDTARRTVRVYPGFFPGFKINSTLCTNAPVQFVDTSKTNYGAINSWRWNFGDLSTLADTSYLQNPVYSYLTPGSYTVELKVTNTFGCEKTIFDDVTLVDPPLLGVFPKDTAYCRLDSLQLNATGTGTFNWLPPVNILGANTATPTVFPNSPIKYYVTLTSAEGCISKDSVNVTPKNDVTNSITANPPNICEEDTLLLSGTSNYTNVTWQWSPAATIEFPAQQNTRAFPLVNTTYTLVTTWGRHCIATATKPVTVKPLAIPNAGPDQLICSGQTTSAQLTASGGNTYTWSPPTGLSNTNIANPTASPTVTTTYAVAVGVTGCAKTRTDTVTVVVSAPPPITPLNDTLICNIDTLQLTTVGTGSFLWSPNYMISSLTAQSPLVSPDVPTKYYVRLTDIFGCVNTDSVFVDVKDRVTLFAGNDTTICQTDGFRLTTVSDALHYQWTPATYLDSDTAKRPFTTPLNTITYHVVANIGKCQSSDDVTITAVPYPAANAGPDQAICPEWNADVQLNATGGSSYLWTPSTFLSNRTTQNPVAVKPTASIRYIVAVTDTLGCPKPVRDTVWVIVHPKVIANAGPADTIVVLSQPLVLTGTGGVSYLWSPATWLNSDTIQKPTSRPQGNIRYTVTATSVNGCTASDFIDVIVYRIEPDMYVPNAFTPNGDKKNDIFRPILIGMKELRYFRVYNRFGQLVYSTSDIGSGWDGTFRGRGQDPATYVWYGEAVTYTGEVKFKKGYVVLIRE